MGPSSTTAVSGWVIRLISVLLLLNLPQSALCQQLAKPRYHDCSSRNNVSEKLNITDVCAQVLDQQPDGHLNITIFGVSPKPIYGYVTDSPNLATLFTATTILTFNVWMNSSYFCLPLRPPSPLPPIANDATYCPIPAGPFGFSVSIPWSNVNPLTTLATKVRAVDPAGDELLCLDIYTTPLTLGSVNSPYGSAVIILWSSVALAIAYWLVVGIARLVAAWRRGASRSAPGWWPTVARVGFILASAISGERLSASRALLRFGTPSMRDVIFHTQWCAALVMVAVQWPEFAYPLLSQTAWAMLSYNITIGGPRHWYPLSVPPFVPPSGFADQVNDVTSSLYIDPSTPNNLFTLPGDATAGLSSFAYTIGVFPEDLFGICLSLFLSIVAVTISVSLLIWMVDWIASVRGGTSGASQPVKTERIARNSTSSRDMLRVGSVEESTSLNGNHNQRPSSRFALALAPGRLPNRWWRMRPDISSFHSSVLHGNLVRILVLFHLPVTIFSCYQMTIRQPRASPASVALASCSFVVFSLLLPIFLVWRVKTKTTAKLYDETRTLLCFGPLYNHYRHGSQLFACLLFASNLAFGITIGCGQRSGTAQAVIILVVEVISALVTSIWLPWGQGASMGLISFLFCVARIIVAVMLVILSPAISIGAAAGGWVAYGILLILGLVYLAFTLMLVIKIIEAALRIFGGIGFDAGDHSVDSGLFGACGLLGCCGFRKRRRAHRRSTSPREAEEEYAAPVNLATVSSEPLGPPSVLRPEHALMPYKEAAGYENGYIMGDWRPYPQTDNAEDKEAQTSAQAEPAPATTGFSRIGGGRAHFDAPYAITSRSTLTVHSVDQLRDPSSVHSTRNFPQHGENASSAEAIPAAHLRTKSRTAVIEHPPHDIPMPQRADTLSTDEHDTTPSLVPAAPFGESQASPNPPKKSNWYQLIKAKWPSEGDTLSQSQTTPSASSLSPDRSFVVIRDRKPQGQRSRNAMSQQLSDIGPAQPSSSFQVISGSRVPDLDVSDASPKPLS